jgi:proton-dependent oligopeptide transporter, POT family
MRLTDSKGLHSNERRAADRGWAGHPRGLSTLFFTEMWERFSYYGMRALLVLFMVAPVAEGGLGFAPARAGLIHGTYTMSVFMLTVPGGFIGDNFFGARRAVIIGGLAIAAGHFTLALASEATFFAGLTLVALGTGLLKANISSMVGSLYAVGDARRDAGFSIFYMGINIGAFIAPLVTGYLAQSAQWKTTLARWGLDPVRSWHWGFAAAGVGMTLGLIYYLATAKRIAHVGHAPAREIPRPWGKLALVLGGAVLFFLYVVKSDEPRFHWMRWLYLAGPVAAIVWFAPRRGIEARRMAAVFVFFIAAMVFWAMYEQGSSTFALFGDRLTRTEVFGWAFPSAGFQSLPAIFVVLLAPAFAWLWLRLGARQPSSPVKFALGLAILASSFVLMIPAAHLTAAGKVSPFWLVGLFCLQSIGELCLSPVGLSTMTKLAPARLAGLVMGIWFLADSLGNKLAGVLAGLFTTENPAELAAVFGRQALVVGACAVALLVLRPWVKKLIGGVE